MNNKKPSQLKAACSVSEMAQMLELSRARFYQLLNAGFFPPPIYSLRTRRPFFDAKLQQACVEIRETGVGYNGEYILFYAPRKTTSDAPKKASKQGNGAQYKELVETMGSMGLEASSAQVKEAVELLYPHGSEKEDQGVVIREVFRFLKKKGV